MKKNREWNKEKEKNFALCACLKPKVDLFDPEWKGSLVFTLHTTFWTVC